MKKNLTGKFGKEKGLELFRLQKEQLSRLLENTKGKSKGQLKMLKRAILPPIALYNVLIAMPLNKEAAFAFMKDYFYQAGEKAARLFKRIEYIPFFYNVYRMVSRKMIKLDYWNLTIEQDDKRAFVFTIKKCLWHDTCVEQGCPEICELFCKSDDQIYGALKKIGFRRSKTLGMGGDCCDFRFLNAKYSI